MNDDDRPARKPFAFGLFEYAHLPLMSAVCLGFGIMVGLVVLPDSWSLLTRLGAGFAMGLAALLSFFANRMIGGSDFE